MLSPDNIRMQNFLIGLATLFDLGKKFKAPGTIGTLAAVPLVLLLSAAGPLWHMAFAVIFLPISILSCELYEQSIASHDAKEIILDEVLGFIVATVWLPWTWQSFLAAFLLFRFFDIIKPFPISVLDQKVKGGVGVVADDLAAGIATNAILQALLTYTNWLGFQYLVVGSGG
jgi:phosphatidylglycerophosphatase A